MHLAPDMKCVSGLFYYNAISASCCYLKIWKLFPIHAMKGCTESISVAAFILNIKPPPFYPRERTPVYG